LTRFPQSWEGFRLRRSLRNSGLSKSPIFLVFSNISAEPAPKSLRSMSEAYFDILDNTEIPGRWFLKSPLMANAAEVDPNLFRSGNHVQIRGSLQLPVRNSGSPLDFTFADLELPVLRLWTAELIAAVASDNVQLIPIHVEGQSEEFAILNVLSVIDCFDRKRSVFDLWGKHEGSAELEGKIAGVYELRIDRQRTKGKRLFRIVGWEGRIIVCNEIKSCLEANQVSGIIFNDVS
jgi:hypothetical protein